MAGLAAAWRLSGSGWRDEFASITVYQRGWRLGGKGASSRGRSGRIEEHGLHVWLGYYENAFRLLRECYEELDRTTLDPDVPIRTWTDAIFPSDRVGLPEQKPGAWEHWLIDLPRDGRLPGDPRATGRELTAVEFAVQAVRLVIEYLDAVVDTTDLSGPGMAAAVSSGVAASVAALAKELTRLVRDGSSGGGDLATRLALAALDTAVRSARAEVPGVDRTWHGMALTVAALRGIVADGLLTKPGGLRAINDEEYLQWIARHGGPTDLWNFPVVRGLYDLVFGFAGGDPARPSFAAGTAVLFGGKALFDYRGSFFWKMAAGMGEIVFAPLYEVLRRRGVEFEFFHRVDQLHPSPNGHRIESISAGRQAQLADSRTSYDPLVRYRGLPCFPDSPQVGQLSSGQGIEGQPLESHWCTWPDAERRVLRVGSDFDIVVLAIPPGMARYVCTELIADRPEWREMVDGVATVATQSFQLWLREPEAALGWDHSGSTLSAFEEPFSTWASMPQLLDMEEWPEKDRPKAIAYFCGALDAPMAEDGADAAAWHERVRDRAVHFLDTDVHHLLPGAVGAGGFRWELLCGAGERVGPDRFGSQYWRANVDPSDRYVQSLPGTDRFRLRSDESGYDNLFLAGDWTDSGINAGCIEAAVLSGLQAANAVRGQPRNHQVAGFFMP
jgi:uncharacterized protein with NAD-binding domain and iron-sulfur cluster